MGIAPEISLRIKREILSCDILITMIKCYIIMRDGGTRRVYL